MICFIIYQGFQKIGSKAIFLSTEFNERIIDIYKERSYLYLELTNTPGKIKILDSYNYDYEEAGPGMGMMLEINDRVIKNECSDTLYVIKGNEIYHFLIGDRNYNHKSKPKKFIEKYNKTRRIMTSNNDCL